MILAHDEALRAAMTEWIEQSRKVYRCPRLENHNVKRCPYCVELARREKHYRDIIEVLDERRDLSA